MRYLFFIFFTFILLPTVSYPQNSDSEDDITCCKGKIIESGASQKIIDEKGVSRQLKRYKDYPRLAESTLIQADGTNTLLQINQGAGIVAKTTGWLYTSGIGQCVGIVLTAPGKCLMMHVQPWDYDEYVKKQIQDFLGQEEVDTQQCKAYLATSYLNANLDRHLDFIKDFDIEIAGLFYQNMYFHHPECWQICIHSPDQETLEKSTHSQCSTSMWAHVTDDPTEHPQLFVMYKDWLHISDTLRLFKERATTPHAFSISPKIEDRVKLKETKS